MNKQAFASISDKLKRGYRVYDRFMEKQGFYVVLGICVAVIVFSAIYTFRMRQELENPALSEAQQQAAQSVGSSQGAETLREAQELIASKSADSQSLLPMPTVASLAFQQPVAGFVGRAFSETEPQYFAQSSVWQIHAGLDLETNYGSIVSACASGKVTAVKNHSVLGLTIVIQHEDGYESLYAGLSDASYVHEGDPVTRGQTIGHSGNGVLYESDATPHLHLEVRKNDKLVDPLPLFLSIEK